MQRCTSGGRQGWQDDSRWRPRVDLKGWSCPVGIVSQLSAPAAGKCPPDARTKRPYFTPEGGRGSRTEHQAVLEYALMDEAELKEILAHEYQSICRTLSLEPVNEFVTFAQKEGSTEVVATFESNGAKKEVYRCEDACGYRPGLIFVSVEGHGMNEATKPERFPPDWTQVQQRWRADLWHEVCHQFQDMTLGMRDPHDGAEGHRFGWTEAMIGVARVLEMPQTHFVCFVDAIWGRGERGLVVGWRMPTL